MDPTNPQTSPASGGIDYDKLGAAIAAANKPLLDRMTALEGIVKTAPAPTTTTTATADTAAKPLTAADFSKMLDEKLSARDQSATVKAARDAVAARMTGIPDEYKASLPQTADAGELAKAEQAIRTKFAADFKIANPKGVTNVAGDPPANAQTATRIPVDTSKMSGTDLLKHALTQEGATTASADGLAAADGVEAGVAAARAEANA